MILMVDKIDEVNRIAKLLIQVWESVDEPVNVSRVANFADMARAIIKDQALQKQQLQKQLDSVNDLLNEADVLAAPDVNEYEDKNPGNYACAIVTTDKVREAMNVKDKILSSVSFKHVSLKLGETK